MSRPKKELGQELRRQYTMEFKREAVRRASEGDKSLRVVAMELGIRVEALYQWRRQLAGEDPRPSGAPPSGAATASVDDEVKRLRVRVAQLEEEAVIMGKAMAFFAKRQR